MYDLILKNCNIVNEDKIFISDIAIKDERIALINPTIDSEAKEIKVQRRIKDEKKELSELYEKVIS